MKQLSVIAFLLFIHVAQAQTKKTASAGKSFPSQKTNSSSKKDSIPIATTPAEPAVPKTILPDLNLDEYAKNADEQAVIKTLDSLYPNTIVKNADVTTLFRNRRFDVIKHLITQFELKPTPEYLMNLNYYGVVCGAGLKRTKTYSPACQQPQIYETSPESERKIALARVLLDKGIKADLQALNLCVSKNEFALFKLLYQNFNGEKSIAGEALMVEACEDGCIDFVKFLLENKVSPNAYNHSDEAQSSRFYAIYRAVKYPEIFMLLVEKGADTKIEGYKNLTPIVHAAREGCIEVIRFLLDQKIDPYEVHGTMSAYDMAKKFNNNKDKKEVLDMFEKVKK